MYLHSCQYSRQVFFQCVIDNVFPSDEDCHTVRLLLFLSDITTRTWWWNNLVPPVYLSTSVRCPGLHLYHCSFLLLSTCELGICLVSVCLCVCVCLFVFCCMCMFVPFSTNLAFIPVSQETCFIQKKIKAAESSLSLENTPHLPTVCF